MKTHNGRPWPEHWSLQLHFLWKELQLGGLHENSYWPPMACILIPTTALSVERASAGRTSWKLILAAHGGWSLQLQCMWKKLQLGALHENSCSPPSSKRKAWLENTPFALSNFSRTGWVYTGSSRIYCPIWHTWQKACPPVSPGNIAYPTWSPGTIACPPGNIECPTLFPWH